MLSIERTYQQVSENLESLLNKIEVDNSIAIITRPGHKDIAMLPAEELNSLLETVHLLRNPANAQRLFAAIERSIKLDSQEMEGQTIEELCEDLGIERER